MKIGTMLDTDERRRSRGGRDPGRDQGRDQGRGGRHLSPNVDAGSARQPLRFSGRRILGAVLILVSVGLGISVVERADQRSLVVVAARPLVEGALIESQDLTLVPMYLGNSLDQYLTSTDVLVGSIATKAYLPGELIQPLGQEVPNIRVITVPLRVDRSPDLARGDRIDLWSTPAENGKTLGSPRLVGENLVVVAADIGQRGAITGRLSLSVAPSEVISILAAVESSMITAIKR